MTQYVQYLENGIITGTVITQGDAPLHERQLVFEKPVPIEGKMVDVESETLVDAPGE